MLWANRKTITAKNNNSHKNLNAEKYGTIIMLPRSITINPCVFTNNTQIPYSKTRFPQKQVFLISDNEYLFRIVPICTG